MFSGIVEERGEIVSFVKDKECSANIIIASEIDHSNTQVGDSIAIDGVCLTVVKIQRTENRYHLSFDVASETLRCTTFSSRKNGDLVHIERSLALGQRMHGHTVTGHVDQVVPLSAVSVEGETRRLVFQLSSSKILYVVPKGSIAIAGVSLTVGEVEDDSFSVYLVPHTQEVTYLGELQIGDEVNVEFDSLGRYVVQYLLRFQNRSL